MRNYLIVRSHCVETTMHDVGFLLLAGLSEGPVECNMVLHPPGIWILGLRQVPSFSRKERNIIIMTPVQKLNGDKSLVP